jgi:hypothetical protein
MEEAADSGDDSKKWFYARGRNKTEKALHSLFLGKMVYLRLCGTNYCSSRTFPPGFQKEQEWYLRGGEEKWSVFL